MASYNFLGPVIFFWIIINVILNNTENSYLYPYYYMDLNSILGQLISRLTFV